MCIDRLKNDLLKWKFHLQTAENFKEIIFPLPMIFWSFTLIFMFCELGERLTAQFDEIDEEIFRSNWYAFPMDVQRMLPLIMDGTQEPIVLSGLGNILCTREAFKNVIDFQMKFNSVIFLMNHF